MKYYLKLLSLPLSLLAIFVSLWGVWSVFNFPPGEVLAENIKIWFDLYGLPVIFISALIEGMLLVGGYFPGVFVIFIGVILADSPSQAFVMVTIGTLGLLIAHVINYLLGKYGWYRLLVKFGLESSISQAQRNLSKRGPVAIVSSYWLPSLAAFTDTAAGILQMPFKKFFLFSLIGVVLWDSVVGLIVYQLGDQALSIVAPGGSTDLLLQLAVIGVWIAILLIIDFIKQKPARVV